MPTVHRSVRLIIPSLLIVLFIFIILFPSEGLSAAERGIDIWWNILFPALFPFFVISEILLGFGIVHFFGTLLDPLMQPLFRVPGIGGFVMAMGFASGYPVGARLTSQLWEQGLVSREEGERLVSFTSTSDPIFLIGAVAVGFFHQPELGAILAAAHYGGGVLVGLIMRFHGKTTAPSKAAMDKPRGFILFNALKAMHRARIEDSRPIGVLLNQAIQTSIKLIFVVGGLVVFFSVILELLNAAHIMDFFYLFINAGLHLFGISSPELVQSFIDGTFEVTLGAKAAGGAGSTIPLIHKVAAASFVLAWSGLSVHAQIVGLLTETNIRYAPFLFARLIHSILSFALVYLLWAPLKPLGNELSAWLAFSSTSTHFTSFFKWGFSYSSLLLIIILCALIALAFLLSAAKIIRLFRIK